MTFSRTAFLLLAILLTAYWSMTRNQPARGNERREVANARPPSPPAADEVKNADAAPSSAAASPVVGQAAQNSDPRSVREFSDRLDTMNACYESEECGYPQTDPHSYDFALGQDLKAMLLQMASFVRSEDMQSAEVSAEARKFLGSADGHVQEAALELMSTQPPSPENLEALINDVLQGSDSGLIDHALLELQRYTSPADLDKINQGLAQALMTGAPFVAREVSTRITPFLTDTSYRFFQDVATRLPELSTYRLNLESSLSEFQRKRRDG